MAKKKRSSYPYKFTPKRRAALKKASLASARKRRRNNVAKATGGIVAAGAVGYIGYRRVKTGSWKQAVQPWNKENVRIAGAISPASILGKTGVNWLDEKRAREFNDRPAKPDQYKLTKLEDVTPEEVAAARKAAVAEDPKLAGVLEGNALIKNRVNKARFGKGSEHLWNDEVLTAIQGTKIYDAEGNQTSAVKLKNGDLRALDELIPRVIRGKKLTHGVTSRAIKQHKRATDPMNKANAASTDDIYAWLVRNGVTRNPRGRRRVPGWANMAQNQRDALREAAKAKNITISPAGIYGRKVR